MRRAGFLERLVALFESDDPEKRKQRQLREIVAELKRSRSRFYNPVKGMAEPGLARFFWEIYKAVAAAQVLLKGAEVSGALKMTLVDFSLGEEQLLIKERLSEKAITERANQGTEPVTLEAQVKQDLKAFLEGIDADWMNEIDAVYNRLLVLLDLIGFDFFFLLKEVRRLPAGAGLFLYPALREHRCGAHVQDDVQDFLEILPNIDTGGELGTHPRHPQGASRHGGGLPGRAPQGAPGDAGNAEERDDAAHGAPLLQNPAWKPMVRTHRERIVEPYLARIKAEAETTAQKVAQRKTEREARGSCAAGFRVRHGGASLTNYSESSNTRLSRRR